MYRTKLLIAFTFALGLAGGAAPVEAQGFQLNRHEPTPSGEWSFGVDHPWYSRTRDFAAGFTLNYGHNPLVIGLRGSDGSFVQKDVVIQHLLLGHFDFALSLWDRFTLSATLPITLAERGQDLAGISPKDGVTLGDPRLGLMARLYGQPQQSAFSVSLGVSIWVPIGADNDRAGDRTVRILPKLVFAGLVRERLRWSVTGGFYYRPEATLGNLPDPTGASIGPALQVGLLAQYANLQRRFAIGPELILHTTITGGNAFRTDYTNLELLLGGHYNIPGGIQTGLALGIGTLRDPGTPDLRLLFRIAYAPLASRGRHRGAVPPRDRDGDLVLDQDDLCPDEHKGARPDPERRGCPARVFIGDRDGDSFLDPEDQCPTVPAGTRPDPIRSGCPMGDRDNDNILDADDLCPDVPKGPNPDPVRRGCPGRVLIEGGKLNILEPVYFATDRDVILARSFPILQAVADVLRLQPELKRISIEGHTDSKGARRHNMDLSARRARSVLRWLVKNDIAASRLESHGYGPTRPITTNETAAGRSENRRVEFTILDTPAPRRIK